MSPLQGVSLVVIVAIIAAALVIANMHTVYTGWLILSGGIAVVVFLDILIELSRTGKR